MKENRVWIFFYGTFMNAGVLVEHGVSANSVVAAKLNGFQLNIRPRVNLTPDDRNCVYGSIAATTPQDIASLYARLEAQFGTKYLPQAVIAERLDGMLCPALCYIAPSMEDAEPDDSYVVQLANCVRELGHPEWYAAYIESFRGEHRKT
jgi:hypothetical protein